MQMKIGSVANQTDLSIDTIRFYERQGLGFSLREIKELLSLGVKSTRECGPVTRKAEAKLAEMESEIERLQRLRRTLRKMVKECDGRCAPSSKCITRKNGRL